MIRKIKYIAIFFIIAIAIALLLGIPAALIPNPFYKRMVEATFLDYFFLSAISILISLFIIINFYYKKSAESKSYYLAGFGTLSSIFVVSCPICNALLVSVMGATFAYAVFEPFRPVLGGIVVIALLAAIWLKIKGCKNCEVKI